MNATGHGSGEPAHVLRINPFSAGALLSILIVGLVGASAIGGLRPGLLSQDGGTPGRGAPASGHSRVQQPGAAGISAAGLMSGCATCGTVEAIRTVQVRGRDVPGAPAVPSPAQGGAGDETGRDAKPRFAYRLTIRMEDGSYRAVSQATTPAFAVGDKVRVKDAALFSPRS